MHIKKYYTIVENRIYLLNFSFFKMLFSDEILRFCTKLLPTIHNIYSLLKYSMELHSYYVFHHKV